MKNSTEPKKGLFKLIQTKALKMAVFTNGGVLAGLKIRHFQGFTVPEISDTSIYALVCTIKIAT